MSNFDTTKAPDATQQLTHDFPTTIANSIIRDTANSSISAVIMPGKKPNVVYINQTITTNFKANQLWIVSESAGTKNKLHSIPGITFNGEMIIKLVPDNNISGINVLYFCFLLASSSQNKDSPIDDLIKNANTTNTVNLNINSAMEDLGTAGNYFVYQSSSADKAMVVVFTNPIGIKTNILSLQNNLNLFPMASASYSLLKGQLSQEGDWMECDYVPIGTDTINTYNLPIQSTAIKDMGSIDTFRTIIMFVVFLFICAFSYLIIPTVYLIVLQRILGNQYLDQASKKKKIFYIDIIVSFAFCATALILICVGAFADPTPSVNSGDLILSGLVISILYIISYIVIQSKKLGGKFIDGIKYE
jgi:hypothetical protein